MRIGKQATELLKDSSTPRGSLRLSTTAGGLFTRTSGPETPVVTPPRAPSGGRAPTDRPAGLFELVQEESLPSPAPRAVVGPTLSSVLEGEDDGLLRRAVRFLGNLF